ncbi:MAG: cell division protein SepF [Saccharofermentanales bacterium]
MAAFLSRIIEKVKGYDLDDNYDEYEEYEDSNDSEPEIQVPGDAKTGLFRRQSKVVDFAKPQSNTQQVVIIQPSSIEAAQEVCNHLRGGRTVICNFEKVDQKVAQRVMDFITGATYAIDGQVHKVSPMIFVTVPRNVALMDEENPIGMDYAEAREMYAAR